MRYLLDTTLLIDHANGHAPATELLERLYEQGAELFTCEVVVCEALSGGTDAQRAILARLIEPLEYVISVDDLDGSRPVPLGNLHAVAAELHEMTKATKELNEIIRSASLEPV